MHGILPFLTRQALREVEETYQDIESFLEHTPKEVFLKGLQRIAGFLEGKEPLSLEEVLSVQEVFRRLKEMRRVASPDSLPLSSHIERLLLLARSKAKYEENHPLTATEVAALSGTTLPNIVALANKGVLQGEKRGKEWYFPKDTVEGYLQRKKKV
ncbi:helix-turn-helix domain-containing protein [Candidatus Caldatribacterium sp. SIUC1]|uniref:helix-turn-helix domain-containing protein n=1 Tax=Candidatus Caldatribacterium sp. SIUC1 TaxID=3418365 RepID=UPI003F68FC36